MHSAAGGQGEAAAGFGFYYCTLAVLMINIIQAPQFNDLGELNRRRLT
jgi:hypothetical protein